MSLAVQIILTAVAVTLTAVRKQMDRELDPATPPWLTVRMYLTVAALACSVTALCLSALRN